MKTVIITGTSGFIGGYLRDYLVHEGHQVIGFQRKSQNDETRVEYHCFNLAGDIPAEPFERADFLIHTAYLTYSPQQPDANDINLQGTQKLLELCRKHQVHFTFLSTMSAHEQAASNYGKSKLQLEKLFDPMQDLVLRLGLVLGQGGLFQNMSEVIKKSKLIPLIGGGKQPLQTIAIDDLAQLVTSALEKKATGKLTLAHPDIVLMKEFYRALAEKHQVQPTFVPVPIFPVMAVCKMAEALGVNLPITSENVLGLKHLQAEPTEGEAYGVTLKSFADSLEKL